MPLGIAVPAGEVSVAAMVSAATEPARTRVPSTIATRNSPRPASPFAHRLWVIRRNLPAILAFVAVCTIATAIISYRLTPIYEATATIDVDRRAPTGVVGQDATTSAVGDTDQFLNTHSLK